MKLYVSTADTSGELHAAALLRACRAQGANPDVVAMGSAFLREAGADVRVNPEPLRRTGPVDILLHLPSILAVFRQSMRAIEAAKPDAVLMLDSSVFHLRLARRIKRRFPHMPVIYYILPQLWASRPKRVRHLQAHVDLALSILPFEPDWLRARGVDALYVGSPVRDAVQGADGRRLRREMGLDDHTRLVSIFPGSRGRELRYLLPPLIEAGLLLEERFSDLQCAVAVAPGKTRADLDRIAAIPPHWPVLEGRNHDLLDASHLCLAKSGTTTLEAALLGCPMVMVYKGDWLSAFIVRRLVTIDRYALPNILSGRMIVPELLQEFCNGPEIARNASLLLRDEESYEAMRDGLAKVRELVGEEPAPARAASALLSWLAARGIS